jgi:hypothetical protein
MPGAAGGLQENVNRWRGQVGLKPIELKEILQHAHKTVVDRFPAVYFRFTGPQRDGEANAQAPQKSILVVMFLREGFTWFIKLSGDAKVAAAEEPAFIRFVESIRFPGDEAEGSQR